MSVDWENVIMDFRRASDVLVLEARQSCAEGIPDIDIIKCAATVANEQDHQTVAFMCAVMMLELAKKSEGVT